jgi:hypothetical protein
MRWIRTVVGAIFSTGETAERPAPVRLLARAA